TLRKAASPHLHRSSARVFPEFPQAPDPPPEVSPSPPPLTLTLRKPGRGRGRARERRRCPAAAIWLPAALLAPMVGAPYMHPKAAPGTPKSRRAEISLARARSPETLQVAPSVWELRRPGHNLADLCHGPRRCLVETLLPGGEPALGGAPLASSPPPHLQPASRRPPASGPRAPRAAVSSRSRPGDRGSRRARRGSPSPSGLGGSSQQRRPLTWKVTAEKEEEDGEKEEGEEEGEETPLVPLFSLRRRPLLAKAERVWWGEKESRPGPRGSGGSREARAAAVCVREPQRPPPLLVCGRTGLFLAAPPRTEVTRRRARRGRAGGGRKRERLSQRRHRIPQRVPGREAEPEKPVWNRRAREGSAARGSTQAGGGRAGRVGPAATARCGQNRTASQLSGIRELPGEPICTCHAKTITTTWASLRA
ncbi:hypothetical protein J0S82_010532, partial [Galemys pyrenaicus]